MLEVLSILTIATSEMKQKPLSEWISDRIVFFTHLSIAKYFWKLVGKKELQDALQRLRELTTPGKETQKEVLDVHALSDGTPA